MKALELTTVRTGLYWAAACAVALISGMSALSQVSRNSAPSEYSVFSGRSGDTLARQLGAELVRAKGQIVAPQRWLQKSQTVLRHNPLEAKTIRVAAFAKAATGSDVMRVRALMNLAESVSARDLSTQLWLIEDAVSQGDVEGALAHYDRALSVHPKAYTQLFPVLASAIREPQVRKALVPFIGRNRPWAYQYLGFSIDRAENPEHVAELLAESGGSRAVPSNRPLERVLMSKLVEKGRVESAWHYAQSMTPRHNSALERFGFSKDTLDADFRPFTWSITEDLSIDTKFDSAEGLAVKAGSSVKAVAADRVMRLTSGQWNLAYKVEMPRLSPMLAAKWVVTCLSDGSPRELLNKALPPEPGVHSDEVNISIPEGCAGTRFRLTVLGADAQEDSSMILGNVNLVRL